MSFQGQVVEPRARGAGVRAWPRALGLLLALACVLAPASAMAAPNETVVSSRPTGPDRPDALRASGREAAVSGDGRYVAFVSETINMAPGDPTPTTGGVGTSGGSTADVYVRDHMLNVTRVVSDGNIYGASNPSISADGRHVLFRSHYSSLAPGDTPPPLGDNKLYVRDLLLGTQTLVTPSLLGVRGPNGPAYTGSISADGRYVTFWSPASDLVAGDTNGKADVFVRDRDPDADGVFDEGKGEGEAKTSIVAPNYGDGGSISADGRYLAFSSPASDLVSGDDNGKADVFVRDLQADTTTLVSRAGDGARANDNSSSSSISADGRFVAFSSSASNLVEGATKGGIFVRDLRANTTTLVTRTKDGSPAGPAPNGQSLGDTPSISADGRFVSFHSWATDLVAGDTNAKQDVFVRDLQENTTAVASRSSGAGPPDAAFLSPGSDYRSNASASSMSADGRFVAFDSAATNLVAGSDTRGNAFRRELGTPPAPPTISINDVVVAEGNTDTTEATFTLSLSKPNGQAVSVEFATANGTASAPEDYEAKSGTLTFAPNQTEKTVTVKVKGDTLEEPDESFYLNLSKPDRATILDGQGIATIRNDDAAPAVSIADASVTEGDTGDVDASFAVSLSAPSGRQVTVDFATADGTAGAPADYTTSAGTVTFAPGETSKTVTVKVKGDTLAEPDENFSVNLTKPQNATVADGQGVGRIVDNDAPVGEAPRASIGDVSVTEGDAGDVDATFAVTLSKPSDQAVSVDFATADGTATAPADYAVTSGTVTFARGDTSKTVTVKVKGDTLDEPDEGFLVNLTGAPGATIADGQGAGTIRDDDAAPAVSIADASVTEGDTGDVDASFAVSLSAPSGRQVTVDFATADGAAGAPADYTASAGTVTFAPGQTTQTVTVKVKGDTLDEPDEGFLVNLTGAQNATIADGQGAGTIFDNDAAPALSVSDTSVTEGSSGEADASFTVSLSAPSGRQVTADFATTDASATAPDDYAAKSAPVTFAAGETSKTVTVKVKGDTLAEPDERFLLNLASPQNATIADDQGVGTIVDDDAPGGTGTGASIGTGLAPPFNPPPPGGPPSPRGPTPAEQEAARMAGLRSCLASVASHQRREKSRTKRGSARQRATAARHMSRHARSGRRACLKLHGRTPGQVTGLTARALSATKIALTFNAPGTDGSHPPAARSYLVKQSRRGAIASARGFARAQSLCKGVCRFSVTQVGTKLTLTVGGLRPRSTHHYAIAARDNVSGRLGPRSATASAKTM